MKKHDQRSCARFLEKYGDLYIYDIKIKNRYTIDDKDIHFVKKYVYTFIGNPDHSDGT